MRMRFLILTGAIVMALGLLALTFWLGGPEGQATRRLPAASDLDLSDLPPVGTAPQGGSREVDDLAAAVEQGRYAMVEPGRQTVVQWQRMTPKPQGISEVELPTATITFLDAQDRPRQKMTIFALEGTFVAPGNQFRTGEFRRNVVLTLFEAPDEGTEVRTDNDEHIVLRAYLDENATFEMELGQVTSRGPVHVTGPEVDFLGTGLNLKFNRLRNRIEFLEVVRGERLRLARRERSSPAAAPATPQVTDVSAPAVAQPQEAGATDAENGASAPTPPAAQPSAPNAAGPAIAAEPAEPETPRQFYRARFFDRVRVEMDGDTPEDRLALRAAYLELFFSLGASRSVDLLPGDFSHRSPAPSAAPMLATPIRPAWPASPVAAALQVWSVAVMAQGATPPVEALADSRSLMRPDPNDLVVHWSGRLILEPEPAPPAGLRAKQDLSVRVTGTPAEPVTMESGAGMTLQAAEASYFSPTTRFQATGAAGMPLVLASAEIGTLSGQRLELDQTRGTGHVSGPGWLRQTPQPVRRTSSKTRDTGDDAPSPEADLAAASLTGETEGARDPAGEASEWVVTRTDRATAAAAEGATTVTDDTEEVLTPREADTDDAPTEPGLYIVWQNRLDLAFFLGDRAAERSTEDRSGTDLAAGRLQGLRQAAFEGQVVVEHPELALDAQRLVVDWQPRAEQPQRSEPRRIQASGGVSARQSGLQLRSDELDVALAPRPADRDAADPATTVRSLTATSAVEVQLEEQALILRGHRLVAHPQDDQLDLYAQGEVMAEVLRPDGKLAGQHVVVRRQEQLVRVFGQGIFDMQIDAEDPDARLAVTWQDRMHFDNLAGVAHFVGRSNATTWTREDETHLDSQELTLHFHPFEGVDRDVSLPGSRPAEAPLAQERLVEGEPGTGPETAGAPWPDMLLERPMDASAEMSASGPSEAQDPVQVEPLLEASPEPLPDVLADALAPIRIGPGVDAPAQEAASTPSPAAGDAGLSPDAAPRRGIRQLKRLEATGRVVFVAAAFSDPEHQQPLSRLRVEGPSLVFDTPQESVRVDGAGRMLIEDYRPLADRASQEAADSTPEAAEEPVLFSGRGQTLFTWQRDLVLDLAANDMTQRGDVWMIHRPQTPGTAGAAEGTPTDSIQLYCQELLVDLQDTGGLGIWFSGQSPDTRIEQVKADHGVRLSQGQGPGSRTLTADHLIYDATAQSVRLWAEPGQFAQVAVEGEPAPLRADAFSWDLLRDRIRAENPVGGVVPVGPGRTGGAGGRSRR